MRNKYKLKEKEKEDLSSIKPIKYEQIINFKRSKSPGGIMNKMGPLNRFNRILFENYDKKRDSSVKNDINRWRINNKYNLDERIKKERKGNNINSKLKIIRDSSFSKFDNEESIKIKYKEKKVEKEENIKNNSFKRNENIEKEKENEEKNKEIKSKIKYTMNYIKKQPQKNSINNNNKKMKYIENNKENNNVVEISNIEDFDKPKSKINKEEDVKEKKKRKNMNECCSEGNIHNIINNNCSNNLKNLTKIKNDDILLNKDKSNYDDIRKSPLLEKRLILGKPRQTFQFLVHQAYKNKDLSNSFNKYYESGSRSREGSKIKNNDEKESNIDSYGSKKQILNLMRSPIKTINKKVVNINEFKIAKKTNEEERKTNIKTISLNENNTNHTSSENLPIIKKIIINDNSFNINKNNKSDNMNDSINNINNNFNKENNNNKNQEDINQENEISEIKNK